MFYYSIYTGHAVQMGFSREEASVLLAVVGICSMLGRIMYGWLSDLPKVVFNHIIYNSELIASFWSR